MSERGNRRGFYDLNGVYSLIGSAAVFPLARNYANFFSLWRATMPVLERASDRDSQCSSA